VQRLFLAIILAAVCVAVRGQRRLIVVDVETRVPIRGVNVVSSRHRTDTTDWQGLVTVPDTCRSLSFSHVKYESRLLNLSEVKDTVFLISKLMGLPEVTVYGQDLGEDKLKELKKQMRINKTEAQLAAANPAGGFNILGLIQKFMKRRKESKKERFLRMLEEY